MGSEQTLINTILGMCIKLRALTYINQISRAMQLLWKSRYAAVPLDPQRTMAPSH